MSAQDDTPTANDVRALVTERSGRADDYARRTTQELVELMNDEDRRVPEAVRAASEAIADAVDAIVERLAAGGRLVYVGAGTSGGLAALDAAECEATFSTAPGRVVAVVAGESLESAVER